MIKKGRMKPTPKGNLGQLEMGHLLEPIAAYFYAQRTGNTVINDTHLYQHADFPYALANFDRRIIRRLDYAKGLLECKSCTYHRAYDWADGKYPLYYEVQLQYYMAVDDADFGAFSALWGTNPESDLATPEIVRDKVKEDMIFERLDEWIWSLRNDKPPTMSDVNPALAMESLARIYGASQKDLPTIEFPGKYEKQLRRIAMLQAENAGLNAKIKENEKEIIAHSVRIAELMKAHEHGVLTTTKDKLLVDFATRTTRRVNSDYLKKNHPSIYQDALSVSESRKVKVSIQPA